MATGKALVDGFNASQKDVKVELESRPQGADGDNLVKTKLATGDMSAARIWPASTSHRTTP